MFSKRKGDNKMKAEIINRENELTIEIEELEAIIAPQSSAGFID
jgi:hypothetical protein